MVTRGGDGGGAPIGDATGTPRPAATSPRNDAYFYGKRSVDITVSVVLLVIGLPLFLAIAGAIKATSQGPVLFRQVRVGTRRRVVPGGEVWEVVPFVILKFRTMAADSDETVHIRHIERFTRGTLDPVAGKH